MLKYMQLLIGTLGCFYDDWIGKFYPEDLKDIVKITSIPQLILFQ